MNHGWSRDCLSIRDVNLHTAWLTCICHWGIRGHFPAFSCVSTFSPSFGVCEQPRVWGCCLPFIRCGLIPLWLNTTTKHIFSNVILASVACVCLWCVWVLAFDPVCPLSMGMWLFYPGVLLIRTRELPFLELRLYNHFLIFVIPPNMLFEKGTWPSCNPVFLEGLDHPLKQRWLSVTYGMWLSLHYWKLTEHDEGLL